MSLRLRLALVILAVVVPTSLANLLSNAIDRSIQGDVAELRQEGRKPLSAETTVGRALEIECVRDADGALVADEVVELARERRPKLRGRIEAVDVENGVITLFGVPVHVTAETDDGDPAKGLAWKPGQRVEASCRVDADGRWVARKLKSDEVKASDKLKGVVTAARAVAGGGLELELSGIRVRALPGEVVRIQRGPVHRMEVATQMTAAVQEGLAAAHELVKTRTLRRGLKSDARRLAEYKLQCEDLEDRLVDAYEEFAHGLAESRSIAEEELREARAEGRAERVAAEERSVERSIAALERERAAIEEGARRIASAPAADVEATEAFLASTFEPALRRDVLPRVHQLELDAEQDLNGRLAEIGARSASAARWTLFTNGAGLVLALALGWFVSRSIARPVSELEGAARRIGAGDLSARVDAEGGGELGALGVAFNRMAEDLSASTVSIGQLNDVIDSMAGALFLLGPEGAITSVNPAASTLLGYSPEELAGKPFESLVAGDAGGAALRATLEHGRFGGEVELRRRDGSTIPASFSGAVLSGGAGGVRGFVCLAEDQSEQKRMDEALRRSLSDKELLLRELHHRVKNNLQVITSLLDLQSREISDPRALEKFQESQDRIRSMVLIHEQLFGASDLERVDLRVYLGLLAANLQQSQVDPPDRIAIQVEVEELYLDLDRALACGLIVNELVTNSVKHAFGPSDRGTVTIACHALGRRIALSVADDGRGLHEGSAGAPERLGQNLVRALCGQLQGEYSATNGRGATFRIEFPRDASEEAA